MKTQRFNSLGSIGIVFFFLGAGVLAVVFALQPHWKDQMESFFWGHRRYVLALVQGSLQPGGNQYTLLKVREGRNLYLELHHTPAEMGPQGPVARLLLPDRFDARMELAGKYTNLALVNLLPDPEFEILVPTLDRNLVPRLNLVRFFEATQSLQFVRFPESL